MSLKIMVKVLPWTVSSTELRNYFSRFGKVIRSQVLFDKETGLSKGIGFVVFKNKDVMPVLQKTDHYIESKKIGVFQKND